MRMYKILRTPDYQLRKCHTEVKALHAGIRCGFIQTQIADLPTCILENFSCLMNVHTLRFVSCVETLVDGAIVWALFPHLQMLFMCSPISALPTMYKCVLLQGAPSLRLMVAFH